MERITWLMDNSIPLGGGYSIGLDGIIGLVPGVGDLLSSMISSAIILRAHRAGIPRATLLRMSANVGIDAAVGAIPFAGDLFDFAFKANSRNLKLYREAMAGVRNERADWLFLFLLVVGLLVAMALPIVTLILLLRALNWSLL